MARGALASVVLTGLGAAAGYLTQIFISRTLGAQEFGKKLCDTTLLVCPRVMLALGR